MIHSFPCGHTVEYHHIAPSPNCPMCRRERAEAFGREMSATVRRDRELADARHLAEVRHSYRRPHDRSVCGICALKDEA